MKGGRQGLERMRKKKDHKTNKQTNKPLIHLYACKEWFPYCF